MSDRLRGAFEDILDALLPRLNYYVLWEYRVVLVSPGPPVTIDARTSDPSMPDLAGVRIWPGPGGVIAVPAIGSRIRVGFINGDPSRPAVLGLDPESQPTLTMIGGAPGAFVARVGDTVSVPGVQAGGATVIGTILTGSATVQATP